MPTLRELYREYKEHRKNDVEAHKYHDTTTRFMSWVQSYYYSSLDEKMAQTDMDVNVSDESIEKIVAGVADKLPRKLTSEEVEQLAEDLWNTDISHLVQRD